jgi:hypothetical protein
VSGTALRAGARNWFRAANDAFLESRSSQFLTQLAGSPDPLLFQPEIMRHRGNEMRCGWGQSGGEIMGIHLEPVTAVLRLGKDLQEYGDPYEFSATVIIRGHQAELVGGAGKFDPKWRRDVCEALLGWGITEVVFDRKGATRSRSVRVKTYRPNAVRDLTSHA